MTGGFGATGAAHMLCSLFASHPELNNDANDIHIHRGRVDIEVVGEHGVLKAWCRAVPHAALHTCLVPASYGLDEADVIEGDHIRVTVRRPLLGPGGVR